MERLREVDGDNVKQKEHLVEVIDSGAKQKMTREEVDKLKERQDIRVNDQGDKATILHKLRG